MGQSTFLIKSTKNKSFGTAFCIDKDSNGSFLLTCEHVVSACGADALEVNGLKAELQVSKVCNELIDLAVIYVKGLEAKPFSMLSSSPIESSYESILPHSLL